MHNQLNTYCKTKNEIEKQLGQKPSIKSIAAEMKVSIDTTENLKKYQEDTLSLNELIYNDDGTEFEELIPSSEIDLEEMIISKGLNSQIKELFKDSNLIQREIEIVILRLDLSGEEVKTLKEVGKKFDLSREKVRHIKAVAIKKIRYFNYIELLLDYMTIPEKSLENIILFRKMYREKGNSRKLLSLEDIEVKEKQEHIKKLQTSKDTQINR